MQTYIDDNFGHWDIQDEDDLQFYHQVQAESVWKRCSGCHRLKRLRPSYGVCDSCATKMERGYDLDPPDITEALILEDIESATQSKEWDKLAYLACEMQTFLKLQQENSDNDQDRDTD